MGMLFRILVLIPMGFVAACLAAGFTIVAAAYDFAGIPDFDMDGFAIGFALLLAAYAGAIAALPMLCAILLAEAFGWRSFFFWAPLGGAIGFVAGMLVEGWDADLPVRQVSLYLAAGLVAGAAYWLAAGRKSGFAIAKPASHP